MNSRPPPPQGKYPLHLGHAVRHTHHHDPAGAPPSYAIITRVYRRSLRPIVGLIAFLAGLWTLFGAIGYFRNSALDRIGDVPKLRIVYIILGALYMGVAGIEALGIAAAATQRVPLVRTYAYLSAVSALIVIGTGLLRIIVHFTMKNDLINTCTQLTEGGSVVYFGFWGPVAHDLTAEEAQNWCRRSWEHDSWEEIIAFLITSFLACFFSAIAFGYLRQLLDPSSPANASRAPSHWARNGNYPEHYNQPYNGPATDVPYAPYGSEAFIPPPEYKSNGYTTNDDKDGKNPFGDHASGSAAH